MNGKHFLFWLIICTWSLHKALSQGYNCGRLLRDLEGSIGSPDNDGDGQYDSNQYCRWTILADENKMVQLEISEMDIEEQDDCFNDYLAIYDGNVLVDHYCGTTSIPTIYDGNVLVDHYCGTSSIPTVSATSRVVYLIFVSNDRISGKGFVATYKQVNDFTCGHVMTLMAGNFRSADTDGDGYYENDARCIWIIEKSAPANAVQILVTSIDIELNDDCADDFMQISDNLVSSSKYCGSDPPQMYIAANRYVFIFFESDGNHAGKGFTAIYANQDEDRQCGGILTANSGVIMSVDRDGDGMYDNNLECVWVIVAPNTTLIELVFSSMEIEWHKNCESDYVRVFDGYNSYPFDGLIAWLCERLFSPKIIISSSNVLFVEFVSDPDFTYFGFEATYRHVSFENVTFIDESKNSTEPVPTNSTDLPLVTTITSQASYYHYMSSLLIYTATIVLMLLFRF